MKRRTAITAIPLAIAGLTAAAKSNVIPLPTNKDVLSQRELRYVFEHLTEASTTDIPCTFIAFARHVSTLASSSDCERLRADAELLIDYLYQEHNWHNEPRDRWLSEASGDLAECVDMDDSDLSDAAREQARRDSRDRHVRRGGESYEV